MTARVCGTSRQATGEAIGEAGTVTGIEGMGAALGHGSAPNDGIGSMLAPGTMLSSGVMLATGGMLATEGMLAAGATLSTGIALAPGITLSTGIALAPGIMLGAGTEGHGEPADAEGAGTIDAAGEALWPRTVVADARAMLATNTAKEMERERFMTAS